ncbi:hypothetical protein Hanom_Chr16g01461831 [Helianthus anomalus]
MKSIPPVKEQIKIDAAKRAEKERLKQERHEIYLKSFKPKKVDEGIIDVEKQMTAENLTKKAVQVLMAKELEVDSKSASKSESSEKVSSSGLENEPGKSDCAKSESICIGCTKECNTREYLSTKRLLELPDKIGIIDSEVLGRDKLIKASNERIKELNEKIENDKSDLQFQEAKIENEGINLKLNSYSSASFVHQHIVPKPIGNKASEDVYSDGTGVGYHNVPPPICNNFTKKQSGLANESETSEKTDVEKLPENIDVTFTSQTDEDSIQSEVVKNVVENVLKSDSDSKVEDDECFLNNYIPKIKSQDNLSDEPTLVMYKMSGSHKLYSDI